MPRSSGTYQVMMFVLAHQCAFDTFLSFRQIWSDSANVDEETVFGIDPTGVNYVQSVGLITVDEVWVDLEQVGSAFLHTRKSISIFGHVVVLGQEGYCWLRNLNIDIGIPW